MKNETEREFTVVYDFTREDHLQAYPPAKAARITGAKPLVTVTAYDRHNAVEKARLLSDVNDMVRQLRGVVA